MLLLYYIEPFIELLRLTSRNLHSDILAGNQETARAAVALVSTVVEQQFKTRLFRPYKTYVILTWWTAAVRQDARTCRGKLY